MMKCKLTWRKIREKPWVSTFITLKETHRHAQFLAFINILSHKPKQKQSTHTIAYAHYSQTASKTNKKKTITKKSLADYG